MRKLRAILIALVLLFSTINSPIFFSQIVLSQEGQSPPPVQTSATAPPPTTTETRSPTTVEPFKETLPPITEKPPEVKTTEIHAPQPTCPAPPQPPTCSENQGLSTKFDDKGCVSGYDCKDVPKVETGKVAACPEVPPPTITCRPDEQLHKATDDKGCVVGFSCASTTPLSVETISACPSTVQEKPSCDGSVAPVYDKGCLISYTCVPESCRQETDASGFVRVVCKQERTCHADEEQAKLKAHCASQSGSPIPFQDPSGCTFYDCRFDNRGVNANPLGGHQSCPSGNDEKKLIDQCRDTGLVPSVVFEGGCKLVKCSQEAGPVCRFVPDSERLRIENECSAKGGSVIRNVDKNGCTFYRCGGDASAQSCQRNIPSEAYKKCDSVGGEMVVKNDNNGCIVFSQCVTQGDDKQVHVDPIGEIPDTTALLSLALKLEKLKIELGKLSLESKEISKYYASAGSLDEERYNRVSDMFDSAANKIDEIKTKIKDNVDGITKDDMVEIRYDIKYIKEVTLKDILYVMLSSSDDVKETLESSRKISTKSSIEEIEKNAKDCGTDGSCFDRAIRSCKSVTFQPEGRNGPLISITGLNDKNCVLHVTMQSSDKIPPGFSKDNFFMDCSIANYALGIKGPDDIIPTCEGPMAKFAKQFGGGEVTGGQSFPPPEGGPGGCETEKECAVYCINNYDDCKEWIKDHPAYGPMPSKGELRQFASGRQELKQSQRQQVEFSGPGDCRGPEECDTFCRNSPGECIKWCKENPDICPQEKLQQPRQIEQRGEEKFRKPSQSGDVQACVGCLNNGVCDIGECSECGDCLRSGGTSIPPPSKSSGTEPVQSSSRLPQEKIKSPTEVQTLLPQPVR